jgi:hypothetical protein
MIMEMGELWIYQWWTHIPEWSYACQYYWVRLAKKIDGKSFLKKFKTHNGHLLTKPNINKSYYVDSIWLW